MFHVKRRPLVQRAELGAASKLPEIVGTLNPTTFHVKQSPG